MKLQKQLAVLLGIDELITGAYKENPVSDIDKEFIEHKILETYGYSLSDMSNEKYKEVSELLLDDLKKYRSELLFKLKNQ